MLLVKNFIIEKKQKLLKNVTSINPATKGIFYAYDWPGNVRELQHAIEYAMNIIPAEMATITPNYIPEHILAAVGGENTVIRQTSDLSTMDGVMQEAGRQFLHDVLLEHGGNISKTADAMGITRQNLQHRMRKLGVRVSDWKNSAP